MSLREIGELDALQKALQTFCAGHGLAGDAQVELATSVEELVVNSFKHGQAREVTVTISADGADLVVEIRDDGGAYNPFVRPPPNLDVPLLERAIGGMGIHLVKNLTDSQEYRWEEGRNVMVLRKKKMG
ncbi:MAG TPA: ATP-binding protein [Vicinamibacteria bacterium]|nr:ATP-binding protein [Vicinamibacteria bacterium]